MKKIKMCLCFALFLALLPVCALAAGGCADGEHDFYMADVKYPTCESEGYYILKCHNCGYTKKEITDPPTPCDYENRGTEPPTCTQSGYTGYVCTSCGDLYVEELEPLGHDWKDDGTTYPSCDEPGLEKMVCARCGEKWQNTIPALGHSWVDNYVLETPTCTKEGSMRTICESCGLSGSRVMEATGHSWKTIRTIKEATCTAEGKVDAECRTCGQQGTRTTKKLDHVPGEWTITKQPTEKADGTRTAVCQECGKKIKESFAYVPGDIAIYTRTGKVNLRAGAGKNTKQMGQVAKKGTYLGQLYEAAPDKNGTVWYKIKYKDKFRWVMSDYANAVVDESVTAERLPENGTDLTGCFFRSIAPVGEKLALEDVSGESDLQEWRSDAVYVSGSIYVEQIVLYGEGYSIYGVKVGDKIKTAQAALKKANVLPDGEEDGEYTYRIPALPDALSVEKDGTCGYVTIIVDENKCVEAIRLMSDVAEAPYTDY